MRQKPPPILRRPGLGERQYRFVIFVDDWGELTSRPKFLQKRGLFRVAAAWRTSIATFWRLPDLSSQISETATPTPTRTEAQVSLILKGVEYTGSLPVILTSFSNGNSLPRISITSLNDLFNFWPLLLVWIVVSRYDVHRSRQGPIRSNQNDQVQSLVHHQSLKSQRTRRHLRKISEEW